MLEMMGQQDKIHSVKPVRRYCKKCAEEMASRWDIRFDWVNPSRGTCSGCDKVTATYSRR